MPKLIWVDEESCHYMRLVNWADKKAAREFKEEIEKLGIQITGDSLGPIQNGETAYDLQQKINRRANQIAGHHQRRQRHPRRR